MIKKFDVSKLEFQYKELVESLRETGFAILTNHNIEPSVFNIFYKEWESFFKLPDALKQVYLKDKNYSGYFPMGEETAKDAKIADLKEFYHYYEGYSVDPTGGITKFLRGKLERLGHFTLLQIQKGLPDHVRDLLSEPVCNMATNSSKTLFRILHYPPVRETNGAVRAAEHEDINLITLLPVATNPGLQVLDSKGNWHDVGGEPGDIIINVGDMLQEATAGYLKSTTHRVINTAIENSRYSAPLFIHPRPGIKLSERYTSDSYLEERLRQIHKKGK